MKVKQIKKHLKQSLDQEVPSLLDSITQVPIVKKEVFNMNTKNEKKDHKKSIFVCATSVVLACCLCFFAFTTLQNKEAILLTLDINPSIELSLTKQEKVISCIAKNKDAEKIIKGMDLKGVDSDVALNAIVGSLYKNGYFNKDSKNNDILLSVNNRDKSKTADLESKYMKLLKDILKEEHSYGKIIAQKDIMNKANEETAKKYNISESKAALLEKIMATSTSLSKDTLANMSIKELVKYMDDNDLDLEDIDEKDIDDANDKADDLKDAQEEAQEKIEEQKEDQLNKEKEAKEKASDQAKKEKEKKIEEIEKQQEKIEEQKEKQLDKEKEAKEKANEQAKKEKEKQIEEKERQQELIEEQKEKAEEAADQQKELNNVED